jgi:hypothetical protein
VIRLQELLGVVSGSEPQRPVDAIRRAMATGYVGFISVEVESGIAIAYTFDPAAAWDLMVHKFRAVRGRLSRSVRGVTSCDVVSKPRHAVPFTCFDSLDARARSVAMREKRGCVLSGGAGAVVWSGRESTQRPASLLRRFRVHSPA